VPLAALASAGAAQAPDVAALLREGEALWRAGVFAPAVPVLERALAAAVERGDPALQARALNLLADVAGSQGEWTSAGERHARALALAREHGDPALEASILADMGLGHWRRAEYAPASALCQQALSLYEQTARPEGQADAVSCLGRIALKRGEHDAAVALHERALALYAAAGSLRGQGLALEDLGSVQLDRHRYAEALDGFERSLTFMDRAGDAAGRCRVLGDTGYLYLVQGADVEAQHYFRLGLAVGREAGDLGCLASTFSKLGGVYARRGQTQRALDSYAQSLRVRRRIGDRREQGWTLARMGTFHAREGRFREALRHYHEALAIWDEIHDRRAPAWYLFEVGRTHERLGDDATARAFHERALRLAEEIELPMASLVLGRLGRIDARRGRAAAAVEYALQAVQRADATGGPDPAWRTRYDLAHVRLSLGQREEALQALRESLDLIEALRAHVVASDDAQAGWLEERQEVYATTVAVLMDGGQVAQALEVAERSRARAFRDLLAGRESARPGGGAGTLASPARVPPPDLARLREQAARGGSTVLSYFTGVGRVFVWVITPAGEIHGTSSPTSQAELDRLIEKLRRGLRADVTARELERDERAGGGARPDPRPVLRRLHDALIGPVQAWLPRDPDALLTIVPHQRMFLLSFAALRDRSGRYLVERHTLQYSPGLGVLPSARRPPTPGDGAPRVMVVGNPAMPTLPGRRRPLRRLPGAESEARAVSRLFPPQDVTLLLGARATEARVRELAPGQAVLHLATHGVVRDDAPLESLLALAPAPGADAAAARPTPDDGLWTAREVFDLDLHADLVTLSACNTGLGRLSGDGVLGLSRAFLYAGTPSLVVSLWRVADPVARRQMERFYAALGDGLSAKAAALRRAQLGTIADLRRGRLRTPSGRPLPEDPAYWAPFVLVGEGR
jgi:CHAT domain-containing protein/tetratricopeptide (TPR) repeat protein